MPIIARRSNLQPSHKSAPLQTRPRWRHQNKRSVAPEANKPTTQRYYSNEYSPPSPWVRTGSRDACGEASPREARLAWGSRAPAKKKAREEIRGVGGLQSNRASIIRTAVPREHRYQSSDSGGEPTIHECPAGNYTLNHCQPVCCHSSTAAP